MNVPNAKRQEEFMALQQVASENLYQLTVPCIPQGWNIGELSMEAVFGPFGDLMDMKVGLRNKLTDEEVSTLPPSITMAANMLHALFSAYQGAWRQATLSVHFRNRKVVERQFRYDY